MHPDLVSRRVLSVTTVPLNTINCRDQCGRSIPEDQIDSSGWEWLPIQRRYRCTECWRALRQANEPRQEPQQGTL